MEDQNLLGIFVLRRQHITETSLSRKVYLQVPAELLQVPSHRLFNELHKRGSNTVILSYTDGSKDWKAMGNSSADLRADLEERRYLQLHKHLPAFTLSFGPPSQSQRELGKSRTLPKILFCGFATEIFNDYPLSQQRYQPLVHAAELLPNHQSL